MLTLYYYCQYKYRPTSCKALRLEYTNMFSRYTTQLSAINFDVKSLFEKTLFEKKDKNHPFTIVH